jgi:hypothetical protein
LIRDLFHSTEGPIAMPDGTLRNFRKFRDAQRRQCRQHERRQRRTPVRRDGMAGVQVFSAKGEHLGTIPTPLGAQATRLPARTRRRSTSSAAAPLEGRNDRAGYSGAGQVEADLSSGVKNA